MFLFLSNGQYGLSYSDELIAEWDDKLKNGRSAGIQSFVFRKENPKKWKKQDEDDNGDDDDDVLDIEATETTSEKVCQRIEDDARALPETNCDGLVDIDTVKAVDIHYTSKDPRFALKVNLIDECKRLGIPYTKEDKSGPLNLKNIWNNVEIFFSKLHKRDDTRAHDSECFKKTRQTIEWERKGTTAMQRAAALDDSNWLKKKKSKSKMPVSTRHKRISPIEAIMSFPDSHGLFVAEGNVLRCHCNNKLSKCKKGLLPSHLIYQMQLFLRSFLPLKVTNAVLQKDSVSRHLKNRTHQLYEENEVQLHQRSQSQMTKAINNNSPKVSHPDKLFRCSILFSFVQVGIPVNKVDLMRSNLEYIGKKSLEQSGDLKANYIPALLKAEMTLQCEEVKDKHISLFFDATPRQGDMFNAIARFVDITHGGKVVNVSFLQESMDADCVCGEISSCLSRRRLIHEDVTSVSVDACSVNLRAMEMIKDSYNINWFTNLCLSHLANNAGNCAKFVILSQVWSLIQKIFKNSDNAKTEWETMTGSAWKSYSETRWYSQFEVLKDVYDKFLDLEPFLLRLIDTNTSVANANRLYEMLTDEVKRRFIKIELAAIVECLEPMCKFCYKMEGDGQLVFVAGKRVDELHTHYNGGEGLPPLLSVRCLVEESLEFVQGNEEYVRPPANIPPPLTFQQIQAANPRPRRQAAINGIIAAVGALMTDAQRQNRNHRATVQFVTMLEAHQARVDAAIAQTADDMTRYPPQTVEEWNQHVPVGIKPAIDYLFSRISLGGERYEMVQFYQKKVEIF